MSAFLKGDTWYMDTEREQMEKVRELQAQGLQTMPWDLTEVRETPDYAVQFRQQARRGTKWAKPYHRNNPFTYETH